jgi:tellurite resistance protein TehA-like permease
VFGEAGTQVSPVIVSRPSLWLHLFAAVKDPEGGRGAFAFGALLWAFGLFAFCFVGLFAFEYWEEDFTLGLLVWEAFGREKNC